jgi:hypothetical protein
VGRTARKQLERAICRAVPELKPLSHGFLIATPLRRVICGICLNGSQTPDSYYIEPFVQPLYVPTDHLHLTFGIRLLGGCWLCHVPGDIDVAVREIVFAGAPYYRAHATPEALACWPLLSDSANPHCGEAWAYSLIATHQYERADRALSELVQAMADSRYESELELRSRVEGVMRLLRESPPRAVEQLAEWEHANVERLGLQEFEQPLAE